VISTLAAPTVRSALQVEQDRAPSLLPGFAELAVQAADQSPRRRRVDCRDYQTSLTVACELDTTDYPKGLKASDAEMQAIALTGDDFLPEQNHTISPREPDRAVFLA
jgi:hypothetical protein